MRCLRGFFLRWSIKNKAYSSDMGQALHENSGQAFLIVVLIMVIALTVGLSIASRTVTNLKMGSEEANSQKAFSAAEAGIEQYLQSTTQNPTIGQTFNNGSSIVTISRTYVGQGARTVLLNNGDLVTKDEGADIWLSKFDANPANLYATNWSGTFSIFWGDSSIANPCNDAAIELVVITGPTTWRTSGGLSLARYPVENGCANGSRSNNFTLVGTGSGANFNGSGITLPYGSSFTLNNVLFARVIPLFFNTKIGVQIANTSPAFPNTGEGQLIVSQGQSGSTQRQVNYFETWDTVPSAFIFSILSSQ
jgi:Tfp pilus assembly protein PilX